MITAVTGHRGSKLGYGREVDTRLTKTAIIYFSKNRPDEIITGMALGWDMAVAEAADILRIPFTAAVPCPSQASQWPKQSQNRWNWLLSGAKYVHYCCEEYSPRAMQIRNEFMVDNAEQLVALWDGSSGGTGNCIRYATGKIPIVNLWDTYQRMVYESGSEGF